MKLGDILITTLPGIPDYSSVGGAFTAVIVVVQETKHYVVLYHLEAFSDGKVVEPYSRWKQRFKKDSRPLHRLIGCRLYDSLSFMIKVGITVEDFVLRMLGDIVDDNEKIIAKLTKVNRNCQSVCNQLQRR